MDSRLAGDIASGTGLAPLYGAARAQGFRSLWDHATDLVRAGQTTWAECLRILPEPPDKPLQIPESHTLPLQLTFTENYAS